MKNVTYRPVFGLTEKELEGLASLREVCNANEGLDIKLNWEMLTERPKTECNDFLCLDGEVLVGSLHLYCFSSAEAEVSAMVHPDYRREGIFRQLLSLAGAECKKRSIPRLLLIVDGKSDSGRSSAQCLGGTYSFSEYKMEWLSELAAQGSDAGKELEMVRAKSGDEAVMAQLDMTCFPAWKTSEEEALQWSRQCLTEKDTENYLVVLEGETIGKIRLSYGKKSSWVYGFCISPECQGKGYGRKILSRSVAMMWEEKKLPVFLEVACDNERALTLYQNCGFTVRNKIDYYHLPVEPQ